MKKILCLMFCFLLLPLPAFAERIPVMVSIGLASGTVKVNGRSVKAAGIGKQAPWGIHEACVIYENPLWESGETRLAALFDGNVSVETGPVRSARVSHFLQREEGNAILFLAGDGAKLWQLPEMQKLSRTNRIFNHHRYLWARECTRRVSGIRAPNNLSVSLPAVQEIVKDEPSDHRSILQGHQNRLSVSSHPASFLELNWGKAEYLTRLVWDESEGHYLCFRDGAPFLSYSTPERIKGSGIQLRFENVIVQYTDYRWETPMMPVMQCRGSGKAMYYIQGRQMEGSWTKTDAHSPTVYLDAEGREMTFLPGKTYIAQFPASLAAGGISVD